MATATASACDVHLHWCRWFHCESSFNLSLAPNEPGLFAVAQLDNAHKRLEIVKIEAADNLFHALNQLFTAGCPLRESLEKGRCFLRYAIVPDAGERRTAAAIFEQWLAGSAAPSPLVNEFLAAHGSDRPFRDKGD